MNLGMENCFKYFIYLIAGYKLVLYYIYLLPTPGKVTC